MKKHIQAPAVSHCREQPTLPTWFCIGVYLAIASANAQAAPIDLGDQLLDAITAANSAQSLTNHQSSQPATNSQNSVSNHDIVAGTGIVVDQSRATTEFVNEVALTDAVQQDVRAANIVNTAVSDSATGINVFSAFNENSADEHGDFVINQSNLIEQTSALQAEVGLYSIAEGASTRTFNDTRSEYSLTGKHSETRLTDRTHNVSLDQTEFSASVPFTKIDDLVFDMPQPKLLPDITIPVFEFNGTTYLSVVLKGPELILGDIVWSDENGIELQSATLKFPSFVVHVKDQEVETINKLRTVNIGKVTLLDIENPIDELGGLGFAAYGKGEIVTTPGKLSLITEIDLKRILNAAVNLEDIGIPGTNINLDKLLGESLPVFDFEISAELDPFKGLPESFGSDAEAEMFCSASATCTVTVNNTDTTNSEHLSTETNSSMESHSSSHTSSETFSQHAPVAVKGAEAKIVVLGESSANDERYNIVLVAEGSQNGIRVLNGVNTSNSITGNGINVFADYATAQIPAQNGSKSYSQINRITQIGGL